MMRTTRLKRPEAKARIFCVRAYCILLSHRYRTFHDQDRHICLARYVDVGLVFNWTIDNDTG
jgi:hypothetical protein